MKRPYALSFTLAVLGGAVYSFAATVPLAATAKVPQEAGSCLSRSGLYPWSRLPTRTWTPIHLERNKEPSLNAGDAFGVPFTGRLIQRFGVDSENSRETAEFELSNGCRRRYTVGSLSAEDRAIITAEAIHHISAPDPETYAVDFQPERATQAMLDAHQVEKYETTHFTLWYGTKTEGSSYKWVADKGQTWPDFVVEAGDWLETIWNWDRDILHAPMPYEREKQKKKVNIYICGTGLPFTGNSDLTGCWASALDAGWVEAQFLKKGHGAMIHEFGHTLQYFSGGVRDRQDAGPMWETVAQWTASQMNPKFGGTFLLNYVNNLENGPLWGTSRYGAYPFISFLYEQDKTRKLVWRSWLENERTPSGASTEDLLQTIVRLGTKDGIYPKGWRSFADDAGIYGARLVTMDLVDQPTLTDLLFATPSTTRAPHLYTPLAADRSPNRYRSTPDRPLLEFGTHIIPLTPTKGRITVRLTGATSAHEAAWRFIVVSVLSPNNIQYSRLGAVTGTASTSISIDPLPGAQLYLAVTATPGVYETLGWQQKGPVTGTKFPYLVKIDGATAPTGSAAGCPANTAPGTKDLNYNTNGNLEAGRPCEVGSPPQK